MLLGKLSTVTGNRDNNRATGVNAIVLLDPQQQRQRPNLLLLGNSATAGVLILLQLVMVVLRQIKVAPVAIGRASTQANGDFSVAFRWW